MSIRRFVRGLSALALLGAAAFAIPILISTLLLPNGAVGAAYNQSVSTIGGRRPFVWAITSGALPGGLSLDAGNISGTPTTAGSFTFTVRVTERDGDTALQTLRIIVDPAPLVITTSSLPPGTVGAAYSQTLSVTGGSGGYTWTTADALPTGLTLSPSGTITGTPGAAGTANFTVTVTDSGSRTASRPLSITISPAPLTITTSALSPGTVGAGYSQTLAVTGGSGGYTWTTTAGALPAGLTLSGSGTISGTPGAAGTANFTVTVTDSGNRTASKPLSITINPATLTITTASLPLGTVGASYSQTLVATGGSGGYTWTTTAGTLPNGLTLSGSGTISGTPIAAGAANFTVTVTDSGNRTASKPLTITVNPAALTITTVSLPPGTVGASYAQTLAASGGAGGYTWTTTGGTLPAGLTLSGSGTIGGIPTAAGAATFTLTVTDSGNRTASKPLSITINPAGLTVTTSTLPNGAVGVVYSQTLAASGGAGGNTWSISGGALPAGLALAANGTISGTPSAPEVAGFTVQVRDFANTIATKPLSITIGVSALVITTQSLPDATQGAAYLQTLTATGGTGGYRWSILAGALPVGLNLDPAGRISGNADGATSTFSVQVADNAGATATKAFTLSVVAKLTFPGVTTLSSGVVGTAYSTTVAVVGGQPPYTITLLSGQLPPGLALNGKTAEIAGRPTQPGSFSFTLQARDAAGAQTQATFTVTISNGVTVTTQPVLPSGSVSVAYDVSLQAAGGASPYTWSATAGALPAGLTFHPDGKIDGTPSAFGSFTFTATVTDAGGGRASREFTLVVAAGLTITTAPQLSPGVPAAPYTITLVAIGGTPPYVWSISAGALPSGIQLDPATGALSGTPVTAATYTFTATVRDSVNLTAQKAFTLDVEPGLTFTTPAALPNALAGTPYAFTLQASGGQTPYSWRIADGALPDGLSLNASSGVIAGTPSAPGTFNFTVEVVDPTNLKVSRVHTIVTDLPGSPTLVLSGVSTTLGPLQQPSIDLALSAPYPVAITGRLNLAFIPASGLTDDPAVQFSSGGRSATFTIPANDTRATFAVSRLAMQTGSVAGAIQLTVDSLKAGAVSLPAPAAPLHMAQLAAATAGIRSIVVARTPSGFDVQIVALSTTREITGATVRFRPSGAEVNLPLSDAARAWFQSAGSTPYGGQFTLTLPFSFAGGTVPLDSIAVILTNSVGPSSEVSSPY